MALAMLWCAAIDFFYFRIVFRRGAWDATRDLVLQRLISWVLSSLIFGAGAALPAIARAHGLL